MKISPERESKRPELIEFFGVKLDASRNDSELGICFTNTQIQI
jgi:hypothetical protein